MSNYLFDLPEELIHEIYKHYYKSNCINELNNYKKCVMCFKKINMHCRYKEFSGKCMNCNELMCSKCWYSYGLNYNRGWQPHLYHCRYCWKHKQINNNL